MLMKPIFDERHLELARKHGSPDPEFNADLGNRIAEMVLAGRFAEAEPLIANLTDPDVVTSTKELLYAYREGE